MQIPGRAVPLLLLIIAPFAIGCGGEEFDRFDVSGSVSFDGKPLPAGNIVFEPDRAASNEGAPGFALIVDGKFDTAAEGGKGTIGGPQIVRIDGHDPTPGSDGTVLQVIYETKADLPKESTTKDFEIPATAGKRQPANKEPPP
jgi:hypothetical protein